MPTKFPASPAQEDASPIEQALNLVRSLAENSAAGLGSDENDAQLAELERAISQAGLSSRLHEAVERAAAKSSESMEALRLAVCAFTIALRDEGVTPEGVLISLKAAIHSETLIPAWQLSTLGGPHLREKITTWCIQDYFGAGKCGDLT